MRGKFIDQNNIHSINKDKDLPHEGEPIVTLVLANGEQVTNRPDLSKEAVAKEIRLTTTRYFIKANLSNRVPFNPRSENIFARDPRKKSSDGLMFSFIEVDITTYNLYTEFLISQNDYLYNRVRRALKEL
jgi:hypothetical protein